MKSCPGGLEVPDVRATREDEGGEHQEPVPHPLHPPLPPVWSRRVRRSGVGRRELPDGGAGGEAGRAEGAIRLQRGGLSVGGEGGAAGGAAPRRQAVEVRRLLLFCHHCHHHHRYVAFLRPSVRPCVCVCESSMRLCTSVLSWGSVSQLLFDLLDFRQF